MQKKQSRLFLYFVKVQKSFPFNLFIGEGNIYYIWNAYRQAKRLINKDKKITHIFSSFGPYADHYVAYMLKKKYPHLRWTADFRDLQVEPIYKNVIWKGLQKWMERKVLSRANLVTSVSEGYTDQLKQYNTSTCSVPRGVALRPPSSQYKKFTISYTGSLYFDYRNPRRLFSTVAQLITDNKLNLEDIQIVYAGRDGQQFCQWALECGVPENIIDNRGMVSSTTAKKIQNKSHINLLLTSSSPELKGVLTGKVFEYFEAGNPIICLINGVKDEEFEKLFNRLDAGVVVYDPSLDEGKMDSFILSKYQEFVSDRKVTQTIDRDILTEEYSWAAQARKLLDVS